VRKELSFAVHLVVSHKSGPCCIMASRLQSKSHLYIKNQLSDLGAILREGEEKVITP
jgi:ribosome biogenesis protein Nip4